YVTAFKMVQSWSQANQRAEKAEAAVAQAQAEIARLREALEPLTMKVIDYERVNNLAPQPGRAYCWEETERAIAVLKGPSHDA
ncbi:MAG TPA: hypothetical protein VFS39_04160, partial [Nitrospira sp.]|nr:hypothetical protein [Nitrospira sp.]